MPAAIREIPKVPVGSAQETLAGLAGNNTGPCHSSNRSRSQNSSQVLLTFLLSFRTGVDQERRGYSGGHSHLVAAEAQGNSGGAKRNSCIYKQSVHCSKTGAGQEIWQKIHSVDTSERSANDILIDVDGQTSIPLCAEAQKFCNFQKVHRICAEFLSTLVLNNS